MITLVTLGNIGLGLFLAYIKARRNSPFFIFFLALVAMFIAPSIFDTTGLYVDFHPQALPIFVTYSALGKAQALTFGSFIIFIALEAIPTKRPLPLGEMPKFVGLFGIFPFLIPLAAFWGYTTYGASFLLGFIRMRQGELGSIPLFISYCAIFAAPLAALFFARGQRLLAVVSLVPVLIPVLLGGARQALLVSLFALIFSVYHKRNVSVFYFLLLVVLLVPLGDFVGGVLKEIRNLPDLQSRLDLLASLPTNLDLVEPSGESNLRFFWYHIMAGVDIENSGELTYFLRTALVWLPSFVDVFGIKPEDFEYHMFAAVMPGSLGTMHPTYFGSIFADAGFFFPLWIVFTFLGMRLGERLLIIFPHHAAYLYFFSFYVALMWARGSLYAPTLLLIAAAFVALFSHFVFKRRISLGDRKVRQVK